MSTYTTSKARALEDSKRKSSLLKDNSWIKKPDDEDEAVDRDPNFAKTVLSRVKTTETTVSSSEPVPEKTAKPKSSSTSVQALTQRFSGSREDLKSITPSYYSKRSSIGKTETSSTTKTTTPTKEGTTETTTTTTTQSVKSPVTKSSPKTDTFLDRVKASSKGSQYSPYSPTKTTKPPIISPKPAEEQLSNSLTPTSTKDDTPTKDSKTSVTTTVTVKSDSTKIDDKLNDSHLPDSITSPVSSTTTTKKTSTVFVDDDQDAEDKLYDSLIPNAIKDKDGDSYSKTYVSSSKTSTVKSSYTVIEDKLTDSHLPDSIKSPVSSTTTTKTSTVFVDDDNDAEDKLYDSLIPNAIKDNDGDSYSRTYVSSSKTSTVKSSYTVTEDKLNDSHLPDYIKSPVSTSTTKTSTVFVDDDEDDTKTSTSPTNTVSTPVDDLYDTLLPKSITSSVREESPSTPSSTRSFSYSSYTEDPTYTRNSSYSSDYKTYSYSRPDSSYEYSSLNSPSRYSSSSYKSSSFSDNILSDQIYSKSSTKSVYQSPDRPVLEKDLCTSCRKPFTGDAKMVLDDIKLNCHASCFKCEVCSMSLGNLKAGDSIWIYKRMVHCETCFENTRDKWCR
ncbi:sciellin isoform X2 [Fundulus heteroclitus]|uniref:sciellin isoform X2 n=1 Tax=Fundulus heteroclitus TaxID=8078 RepID=UPI00165C7516|nr:sciellin isoform X2 [Fundulus heteroclitus]